MLLAEKKLTVSFPLLFSIYAVVPLFFLVAVVDSFFFSSALQRLLPATPESFAVYNVIFATPHILAGFFSLIDTDYLRHYKKRLLYELPLVLCALVALALFFPSIAYVVLVGYTIYHFVYQQAGLSFLFGARYSRLVALWRWLAILYLTIGTLAVYTPDFVTSMSGMTIGTLSVMVQTLVVVFCTLSAYLVFSCKDPRGRLYFGATAAAFSLSYLITLWGYPLLSIVLLRVIHDLSAFVMYATHDHNRAQHGTNLLYNLFPRKYIPVFILTPLIAIALGYALTSSSALSSSLAFALAFGGAHYYVESFVWKRGSKHREQLVFS